MRCYRNWERFVCSYFLSLTRSKHVYVFKQNVLFFYSQVKSKLILDSHYNSYQIQKAVFNFYKLCCVFHFRAKTSLSSLYFSLSRPRSVALERVKLITPYTLFYFKMLFYSVINNIFKTTLISMFISEGQIMPNHIINLSYKTLIHNILAL